MLDTYAPVTQGLLEGLLQQRAASLCQPHSAGSRAARLAHSSALSTRRTLWGASAFPCGKGGQGPVHVRLVDGVPMEEPCLRIVHRLAHASSVTGLMYRHMIDHRLACGQRLQAASLGCAPPCLQSSGIVPCKRCSRATGSSDQACAAETCMLQWTLGLDLEPLCLLAQAPWPGIHYGGSDVVQVELAQRRAPLSRPLCPRSPLPPSQCLPAERCLSGTCMPSANLQHQLCSALQYSVSRCT